jgi:hypothetical protein
MLCQDALALVPAYLDGEVSEAQAAPLRKHLLACHSCRNAAQEGKSLARWFVSSDDTVSLVPGGFAARVARRAFAGDTGEHSLSAQGPRVEQEGVLLRFVVHFTAAAAAVMLVVALSIRAEELPRGGQLRADDRVAPPVEEIVDALDELNGAAAESATRPGDSGE